MKNFNTRRTALFAASALCLMSAGAQAAPVKHSSAYEAHRGISFNLQAISAKAKKNPAWFTLAVSNMNTYLSTCNKEINTATIKYNGTCIPEAKKKTNITDLRNALKKCNDDLEKAFNSPAMNPAVQFPNANGVFNSFRYQCVKYKVKIVDETYNPATQAALLATVPSYKVDIKF